MNRLTQDLSSSWNGKSSQNKMGVNFKTMNNEKIETIVKTIRGKIDINFEKGGCRIEKAHFQNGRNLHSNQYYFAKNYFQNTENCSELAEVLCSKLQELDFPDDTTLIGFRNYCGLLLKETVNKLGKFNHAIIEENKNGFFWRHLPNLRKNLVILLPIGCSCITYIKLKNWLKVYCSRKEVEGIYKDTVVNINFIVVFLILDKSLEEIEQPINISAIEDFNDKRHKIYSAFNWTDINKDKVFFNAGNNDGINKGKDSENRYKANSLIRLFSNMQLPEECDLCFPTISIEEKPLFPVHDSYENPNLIFRFPNFSETHQKQAKFLDKFCSDETLSSVFLRGHIDVNGTSFSNYIRGNVFYKKNREDILPYFEEKLKTEIKDIENIVFITSENKHSSYFLEELALSATFKKKKVTILRFEPSNEFVDNFVSLYSELLTDKKDEKDEKKHSKIIYFEDVFSAGKAFKLVSDYIKHARLDKLPPPNRPEQLEIHGFDLILTLVDRTPAYTRNEILKKLYSQINKEPEDKFISFFRLNVPITSATHLGNPLKKKTEYLKKLLKDCHLDSVKATVGKEILKRRATNLPEIGLSSNKVRMDYFPFANIERTINKNIFDLYQPYFNQRSLDLLTLYLAHKINSALSNASYDESEYEKCPEKFTEELILTIENQIENKIDEYFVSENNLESEFRNLKVEQEIVRDRIIKILSRPPFTYYRNIYESVFHYCVKELDKLCNKIETEKEIKSFKVFLRLKFLIQRSVELNSNFIVSERFFKILKQQYTQENLFNIFTYYEDTSKALKTLKDKDKIGQPYFDCANESLDYKRKEVEAFFSYLIFCYKQLMRNNSAVSLKLEKLINSKDLSPKEMERYDNPNGDIQNLLTDPYFQLTGMIKAENLNLLDELKELHKLNLKKSEKKDKPKDTRSLSTYKKIRSYYLLDQKNDPIIVNLHKLLVESRHYPKSNDNKEDIKLKENNFDNVNKSIINFLLTINSLNKKFIKFSTPIKSDKSKFNEKANLNNEIKEILNRMISIIEPGLNEKNLSYAFFVETKKKVNDNDSSSIYSITSIENENHPSKIILDEDGIIYNLLHGIYDSVNLNEQPIIDAQSITEEQTLIDEQTLIAGAKTADGKMVCFNDFYRVRKRGDNNENSFEISKESLHKIPPTKFEDLFTKDFYNEENGKGVIFYDEYGRTSFPLNDANMFLAIRFSKLLEPDKDVDKYRFEGRAVLLIMNAEQSSITSFLNFMSNEKVRLLLLLREEFFKYLEEQFDNDAFTEVLVNKDNKIYKARLTHGLSSYLDILQGISRDIKDKINIEDNYLLFKKIVMAMKGQINQFEMNPEPEPIHYSKDQIFNIIKLIFESKHVPIKPRKFENIDISGFPENFVADRLIIDVVLPEILINMNKYSKRSGNSEFTIRFEENETGRTIKFENLIQKTIIHKEFGHDGGLKLCEGLLEKINARMTSKQETIGTEQKFTVILYL